jgi:hypothetical protein
MEQLGGATSSLFAHATTWWSYIFLVCSCNNLVELHLLCLLMQQLGEVASTNYQLLVHVQVLCVLNYIWVFWEPCVLVAYLELFLELYPRD